MHRASRRTKAQTSAIDRLKKKHRAGVAIVGFDPDGERLRVRVLDPDLAEDERDRLITKSGLIQEAL